MYDFGFSNGPQLLENNLPKLQINDARYHDVSPSQSFNCLQLSLCGTLKVIISTGISNLPPVKEGYPVG